MPSYDFTVSCPVHDSFLVQQVAGMFDVPLAGRATERFRVELPTDEDDWQIGLIVGPSASGKSTVARRAFGQQLYESREWPTDRAVVDCFGDLPARQIVELFTAVGFGSPPSWVKPFQALSTGEQFRCELAKALAAGIGDQDWETRRRGDLEKLAQRQSRISQSPPLQVSPSSPPLVVFDEFTSVVDRTVAKVCSAAIAKGIRTGNLRRRFVAVTCHYDVAEWLEPDWVLDMATSQLERPALSVAEGRRLRRPVIELEIHRCKLAAWELFKRHHYLSATLNPAARCYLATWNTEATSRPEAVGIEEGKTGRQRGKEIQEWRLHESPCLPLSLPPRLPQPVFFCATLPVIGRRKHWRFTRIVTLPDYQGIGIGMRCVAAVAELHRAEGMRINVTSSHPALVRHCRHSPRWKAVSVKKFGSSSIKRRGLSSYPGSAGRAVVSFEYLGA
jgi:GNAT superfamily N-acetyltransferase